ncbi:MAG: ATP-binding protein [Gemmatimonadales bacterium]
MEAPQYIPHRKHQGLTTLIRARYPLYCCRANPNIRELADTTTNRRYRLTPARGNTASAFGGKQLPLVGRDEEMRAIASLLRDAKKGAGKTLIVSGEGGVGKTRILTEAAAAAVRIASSCFIGREWGKRAATALVTLHVSRPPTSLTVQRSASGAFPVPVAEDKASAG